MEICPVLWLFGVFSTSKQCIYKISITNPIMPRVMLVITQKQMAHETFYFLKFHFGISCRTDKNVILLKLSWYAPNIFLPCLQFFPIFSLTLDSISKTTLLKLICSTVGIEVNHLAHRVHAVRKYVTRLANSCQLHPFVYLEG